uniref:Uncharacterized protein n=1 Tax=Utricularia reniformis TaxID=192314 RepID=A0A1Y0B2G8_9LAMI|nr:hypothetical protein AEK19_MT1365 [Utricularia reniformis]ART31563.1 hypothetical protein AEK19_MT1365 [Utricularia reniformis]
MTESRTYLQQRLLIFLLNSDRTVIDRGQVGEA